MAEKLQTRLAEKSERSKSEWHQTDMACWFNLVSSVRGVDKSMEGTGRHWKALEGTGRLVELPAQALTYG